MSNLEITKKFLATTFLLSFESFSIYGAEQSAEEQVALSLNRSGVRSSPSVAVKKQGIAGIREARQAAQSLLSNPTEKEKIQKALDLHPGNPIEAIESYNAINESLAEIEGGGGLKTGGKNQGMGGLEGGNTVDVDMLLEQMEDMGVGQIKSLYLETIRAQSKVAPPEAGSWKRDQFIEAIKDLYQPSKEKEIEKAQAEYKVVQEQLQDVMTKLIGGQGTQRDQEAWTIESEKLIQKLEDLDKIINAEELKKKEEEEKAEQRKKAQEAEAIRQGQIEARRHQKIQDALEDKQHFVDFDSGAAQLPLLSTDLMAFFTEKDDKKLIQILKNARKAGQIGGELQAINNPAVLRALRFKFSAYIPEYVEQLLKDLDPSVTMAGINNVVRELEPINLAIENTIESLLGPKKQAPVTSALPIGPEYESAYDDFQKFWNHIKTTQLPVLKSLNNLRQRTGTASDAIKNAIEDEAGLGRKNASLRLKEIESEKWADYTPLEIKAIIGSLKKMLAPIQYNDTVKIVEYLKAASEALEKDNKLMTPKAQERHRAQTAFLLQGAPQGGAMQRGGLPPRGGAMPRGGLPPRGGAMQPQQVPRQVPQQPLAPWVNVPLVPNTEGSDVEQELIAQGVDAGIANEVGNAIVGKANKTGKINAAMKVLGDRGTATTVPDMMKYRNIINPKLR